MINYLNITSSPKLTLHIALLEGQPEIVAALSQAQNITILAPSNDAFAKFLALPGNEGVATQTDLVAALLQVSTKMILLQHSKY